MTDIRLRKMNPGQIGKYARFIPREDIPDTLAGKKRVLGIDEGTLRWALLSPIPEKSRITGPEKRWS